MYVLREIFIHIKEKRSEQDLSVLYYCATQLVVPFLVVYIYESLAFVVF